MNLFRYVQNNPVNLIDPLGLYLALVVNYPGGGGYVPLTEVKNSAQAKAFGEPIGAFVPIAVPPGADPQDMVNSWGSGYNIFNGPAEFAWTWRQGGPNDYKLRNPMWDAYGNFEYGATGAAAGYSSDTLTFIGDITHPGNGFKNYPQNTRDILSGFGAISSGGSLSTFNYSSSQPCR